MRRIAAVICGLVCFQLTLSVAGDKYPASAIPAELKEKVDAVVREDVSTFKITAKNHAESYNRFVVTILNPKGDVYADRSLQYDKLKKITSLKINIYDANGDLIRKVKNSEIHDMSAYDGSLFSDNRLKSFNVTQNLYPYTIELEYENEYKYLYSFLDNAVISRERVSVQFFSYEIISPSELTPRYKLMNFDGVPKKVTKDGLTSVKWEARNVMPIKTDPFGPLFEEIMPQILAAPTVFEYEGYVGNMDTWEHYGQWQLNLNKGRDALPEATKQKVQQLTKGLPTTEAKAKALYEYLQGKTRYVSIQLGIGGLQPFEASLVDQVGYGDCKALSNYMIALLKEAGVNGYFTLVQAGRGEPDFVADFPSHQANHVIVAVPNGADTIWLECTSQTNPFGYQGSFTGDRLVHMITENGGKLVRTKKYGAEVNVQSRRAEVVLQPNGDASAKVVTSYTGLQYENSNLNHYLNFPPEEQKKWVQENTEIPSFNVAAFKFVDNKGLVPRASVDLSLTLSRFASVNGKRIFLTPNLMNRSTFVPESVTDRKSKVIIRTGYVDYDTITYAVPENLYPEFLPAPAKYTSRFGTYESSCKVEQGRITYFRKMTRVEGVYPSDSYAELIEFYKNINRADNQKIVFLNKT